MSDPGHKDSSGWTFGKIREMNLQLEASCQAPNCGWFCRFDIDALIAQTGPDYPLPEKVPGIPCGKCGGELKFQLAYLHPEPDETSE